MVQTIMSDLGMGEDQSKIDALEQYLEENLSTFFSEDRLLRLWYMTMLQIPTSELSANISKIAYSTCMMTHITS